jgi:uncharacterized protein YdhG (YjbR/CyaY superfamily)
MDVTVGCMSTAESVLKPDHASHRKHFIFTDEHDQLRESIRAAAPDATETIAYSMPAFRSDGGQFLVSFAAFKDHYSLFPASGAVVEELGDELAPYLAGKGTLRFPSNEPLPLTTVSKVVRVRLTENAARASR